MAVWLRKTGYEESLPSPERVDLPEKVKKRQRHSRIMHDTVTKKDPSVAILFTELPENGGRTD